MPHFVHQRVLKEISKFKSTDELQAAINSSVVTGSSILGYRKIIAMADRLYDNATLSFNEGDEETSYVLYMRAVEVYQSARKSRDFREKVDKTHWTSLCGPKIKQSLKLSEEIFTSLKKRYENLKEAEEAKIKENAEMDALQIEQNKFSVYVNSIGDLNVSTSSSSDAALFNLDNSVLSSEAEESSKNVISVEQLYRTLTENKVQQQSYLIIDIRSNEEFESSRIANNFCINVSKDCFIHGATGNKIESFLKPADRILFRKRHTLDSIVLVDWECCPSDLEKSSGLKPIRLLYDALNTYVNVPLKRPPVLLDGGFHSFVLSYPSLTTNPSYRGGKGDGGHNDYQRNALTNKDENVDLDFLSYPDLEKYLQPKKKSVIVDGPLNALPIIQNEESIAPVTDQVQRPIIPDRKLKPSNSSLKKPLNTSENKENDGDVGSGLSDEVQLNLAIGVSKQSSMTKEIYEIEQRILDASNIAAKMTVSKKTVGSASVGRTRDGANEPSTISDIDLAQELQAEEEKAALKERVAEYEKVLKAMEEEKKELNRKYAEALRTTKPHLEDQEIRNKFKATSKTLEDLKTELEQARSELARKAEVDRLRKLRKLQSNKVESVSTFPRRMGEGLDYSKLTNDELEESIINPTPSVCVPSPAVSIFPNAGYPMDDGPAPSNLLDVESAPINLRRAQSTPNVAKLIEDEVAAESELHFVPPTPSRHLKPVIPASNLHEQEYFTRSLGAVRGVYADVPRGLTGLSNLGNTCYMNSAIQCLSNTTPLREYFLNEYFRRDINYTNKLGSGGALARSFAVLLTALWSGKRRYIVPQDFRNTIGEVARTFAGHGQQDAQELLIFLLDGLHEDLNRVKVRQPVVEQNNSDLHVRTAAQHTWENHLKVNDSVIVDYFQGQLLNVIECTTCKYASNTFQPLMYLSLTLPFDRCQLEDCLRNFSRSERMVGDSMWDCPKCKRKREANKHISIWKLPRILIIHLNRFMQRRRWFEKCNFAVEFPVNDFAISPFAVGEPPERPYSLYAVVNHYGTMEGGHYTAYCKNENIWYQYDDNEVQQVSPSTVKGATERAYILFYMRR